MSKITATYHAPKDDDRVVTTGGVDFFDGMPVDLDEMENALLISKLRGNQHFEVSGGEPEAEETGLTARHVGGRFFAIFDGDEKVKDGLSKADAEAFNELSAEEKLEYISA